MIGVQKAYESQHILLSCPQDKLAEAVNDLIRAQDEFAETITEIYKWAAAYDNGYTSIELPKVG